MKAPEGARRSVKALDILRCVLISHYQDRYRTSPSGEVMEAIIRHVDIKLCDISEDEAQGMI